METCASQTPHNKVSVKQSACEAARLDSLWQLLLLPPTLQRNHMLHTHNHAQPPNTGVLSRSGTYLVQLTVRYERCAAEQGQMRINLGPCASRTGNNEAAATAQQISPSFELQSCADVSEPGKRKLTLRSQGGSAPAHTAWQLLPSGGAGSVSAESGGANSQPLSCSGSSCVLFVGAGAGKVQPGRSYSIKSSTAADAGQQQQAGVSVGIGAFGMGISAGVGGGSAGSGGSSTNGPHVDKCPPRLTRSTAGVMGACGQRRWLEMQAAAVDLEEGPSAGSLKYYW